MEQGAVVPTQPIKPKEALLVALALRWCTTCADPKSGCDRPFVGWLLTARGASFEGPILCSEPSAKLLPIVLKDPFKLGISRDQTQIERYVVQGEKRIIDFCSIGR